MHDSPTITSVARPIPIRARYDTYYPIVSRWDLLGEVQTAVRWVLPGPSAPSIETTTCGQAKFGAMAKATKGNAE